MLAHQAVGNPYLAWYHSLGGGSGIYITPWRHLEERGGLLLDMGIHLAGLIRYQLGDIEDVYGSAWLAVLFAAQMTSKSRRQPKIRPWRSSA